ncbi:MAG: hypothetical protein QM785_06875 [Pyrinomonadaceae bacterium]
MKSSHKLAGGVAVLVFLALVIWIILLKVQIFWKQDSCLDSGGKWIEDGNYCVMH